MPISAMEGDNVYKPSGRMEWYRGPTFIQALDGIEPEEVGEKPLRFVVQDMYDIDCERIMVGRVDCGTLRKGDELIFQPSGMKGRVEKIKVFPGEVGEARAGDSIGIVIDCEAERGNVGGHLENSPSPVDRFLGEVVLLEGTLRGETNLRFNVGRIGRNA